MTKIELKIEEIPQTYVGKWVAIVDPKSKITWVTVVTGMYSWKKWN